MENRLFLLNKTDCVVDPVFIDLHLLEFFLNYHLKGGHPVSL